MVKSQKGCVVVFSDRVRVGLGDGPDVLLFFYAIHVLVSLVGYHLDLRVVIV